MSLSQIATFCSSKIESVLREYSEKIAERRNVFTPCITALTPPLCGSKMTDISAPAKK